MRLATRSESEVFKRVEKKAMDLMQEARAHAKEKQQIRQTGQPSLFRPEALISSGRLDELKSHYVQLAREEAGRRLRKSKQVGYDVLFAEALRYPLVWEADLKEWIKEWRATKKPDVPRAAGRAARPSCQRGQRTRME